MTTFASTYNATIGELLLDTSYLYYQGPTAVYSLPLDGSAQGTLFQSLTTEFAAGNGDLDWVNIFGDPIATTRPALGGSTVTAQTARSGGVAVDATNIYWYEGGFPQRVYKAALAGGAKVQIGYSNATITGIAIDANNVYWSTYGNGSVATAPIAGGTPTVLANSGATHIKVLADAAGVYMVDDGQIAKLDPAGGAPKVLLTGEFFPQAAVMDATTIFWTNGPTGNPGSRTVMRFPR